MLTPEQVARAVADDVKSGLGGSFEPVQDEVGDGWSLAGDFVDQTPITNGTFTMVTWSYRCRHTGWFQGAPPSGNVLTIHGNTIVRHDVEEPVFYRYVDWLDVMYQLGYSLYLRELVDTADREAINRGMELSLRRRR